MDLLLLTQYFDMLKEVGNARGGQTAPRGFLSSFQTTRLGFYTRLLLLLLLPLSLSLSLSLSAVRAARTTDNGASPSLSHALARVCV